MGEGLVYIKLVAETPEHDVEFVVPEGAALHIDETLIETTSVSRLLTVLNRVRSK